MSVGAPLMTDAHVTPRGCVSVPLHSTCYVDGCESPLQGRGLCRLHYNRWYRAQDRSLVGVDTLARRLWAGALADGSGCWIWQRAILQAGGYGQLAGRGRTLRAHRVAYELVKGPIPDGLQIDHLCRNRACINPDHLEAVTQHENIVRGFAARAVEAPDD